MSEFQTFVDALVGQDNFMRYARKYKMARDCVQIPRMSIRKDIVRPAGESTEVKDQRPVTWEILELNAKTKLDKDDIEASRDTVIQKAKEVVKSGYREGGRIPHLARDVKNVEIDGSNYRMPMENLVLGVYEGEDGYYFDIVLQTSDYVIKF